MLTTKMDPRILAARVEVIKHPKWVGIAPFLFMGRCEIEDDLATAATDGINVFFGRAFLDRCTPKQVLYVLLHENLHKALLHCFNCKELVAKYGQNAVNCAMDYVTNLIIEDTDPDFVERPINPSPLINEKYRGLSFVQVLELFKREGEGGDGEVLDEHREGELAGTAGDKKQQAAVRQVESALAQSKAMHLPVKLAETTSTVKWPSVLREFLLNAIRGDAKSSYHPPNRRFAPQDFLLPSHTFRGARHLLIACDTSGSMEEYYSAMFAEVARILKMVPFVKVTVLWWDDAYHAPVTILPRDLPKLATLLKPVGTGATDPNVVMQYIKDHKVKPDCILYLTDGEFTSPFEKHRTPSIFATVGTPRFGTFKAPQGRHVVISK